MIRCTSKDKNINEKLVTVNSVANHYLFERCSDIQTGGARKRSKSRRSKKSKKSKKSRK